MVTDLIKEELSNEEVKINNLKGNVGSRKKRKIRCRGIGSGLGKTGGRGGKGQTARSGGRKDTPYEGGQTGILRRVPKRGFNNYHRVSYEPINIRDIWYFIQLGKLAKTITIADLKRVGFLKGNKGGKIKLLADLPVEEGPFDFSVEVHAASQQAIAIIQENGGKVVII